MPIRAALRCVDSRCSVSLDDTDALLLDYTDDDALTLLGDVIEPPALMLLLDDSLDDSAAC